MFLKKNNIVKVDFLEEGKESKIGKVKSFDNTFFVVQFEDDDFESLVPYHNVSVVEAINPKLPTENMIGRTQL